MPMQKGGDHHGVLIWFKIGSFVAAVVVFCYTTFVTKEELNGSVSKRLDRIETKLDNQLTKKVWTEERSSNRD